jgi:hypothetical protein
MVSGAERVRGVRYPVVMPSQIAVVLKPVVASSSSGTGAAPREIATQSWDRLRDRG